MIEDRKIEEFEDDRKKWKIHFDLESDSFRGIGRGDSTILLSLVLNKKRPLFESDLKNLKQDLEDLGKLRIIKEGRRNFEKI